VANPCPELGSEKVVVKPNAVLAVAPGTWDEALGGVPAKSQPTSPTMRQPLAANASGAAADSRSPDSVRVLTFNIAEDGKLGVPGIIDLIRTSKADVVGLQEAGPNTAKIAEALGFNHVLHGDTAILTRFKIDSETPGGGGVTMHTDSGKKFAFFDSHLFHKPYQPYQLLGIPYEGGRFVKTEAEAIKEAKKARGANVADVQKDIASLKDPSLPTILVGDFNEPSYLDWTRRAARAGRDPIKVNWPATRSFANDGFKDSYRKLYPDEMVHPGFTWTPTTDPASKKDHHDRIDYILYRGTGIKPTSVQIIGENAQNANIVVFPFPSDHRAVVADFDIGRKTK